MNTLHAGNIVLMVLMQYKHILSGSITVTEYLIWPPGAKETEESTKTKWKLFFGKLCINVFGKTGELTML